MKIALGADHGGFELKEKLKKRLQTLDYNVLDYGTESLESCDYNDVAVKVSEAVKDQTVDRGILICGTGVGMCIQANKVKGIRAALVHDMFTAEATRLHNDTNVLCMGGRIIGDEVGFGIAKIWLETEFSNDERHVRRVNKIKDNE